jgi:FAD synthetase
MRVAIFGTFDFLHPGHSSFISQARMLGEYLLVVVARDANVFKVKGRKSKELEKIRAAKVRSLGVADKVILGSRTNNYFKTLRTYKIDAIALGYDQKPSIVELRKQLSRHRLKDLSIVRLKSYKPKKYKSSRLSNHV